MAFCFNHLARLAPFHSVTYERFLPGRVHAGILGDSESTIFGVRNFDYLRSFRARLTMNRSESSQSNRPGFSDSFRSRRSCYSLWVLSTRSGDSLPPMLCNRQMRTQIQSQPRTCGLPQCSKQLGNSLVTNREQLANLDRPAHV